MQIETVRTPEGTAMSWVVRTGAVIVLLISGLPLLFIAGEPRGGQAPPLFGLFIACLALSVVGALIAFRWARPAGIILIAAGVAQLFLWRLSTNPEWGHLFVFVVPSIALGALAAGLAQKARR